MPWPAIAIAMAPASGGSPAMIAAGSSTADTSGTGGVGQKNREKTEGTAESTKKAVWPFVITVRNGCTIRTSERSDFSAFSSEVISAITRKMLNSSLAATKLALKMLPNALTGLWVHTIATAKVAMMEGTTTLARRTIVSTTAITPAR